MAKQRVRLGKFEVSRLNNLLIDEAVVTDDGLEGRVTRITKGGIQVLLSPGHGVHPFPLYDSFVSGKLRFKQQAYQEEMLHSRYEAAKSVGIQTPLEKEQAARESDKPFVSQLDVPGNIRLTLFFKNMDEEKYLFHMKRVGLKGFEDSLEEGFRQDPFVALRETEYYLGCSTKLLLNSFEEFLQQIFKECATAKEWSWSEPKTDSLEDGSPHRAVWCKHKDDKRSFIVHAVYDDGMRHCNILQVNFVEAKRECFELHTMQCGVLEPGRETVEAFEAAYKSAGGIVASERSATAALSSAVAQTAGLSKNDCVKAEQYGKTPSGTESAAAALPRKTARKQAKPIRVNEFLVRRSYGSHRTNGHSLEPIRATVTILPKVGGDPIPVEFDAYWCPKCRKHFMGEETYLNLKRRGYICCKVVEEKDLGTKKTGDGLYGNLASESILHMYGYTVNQQDDLSEAERQTIISFVIENRIQSAQDVAHLLEWFISQRESNPRMSVAVSRWRADLRFVKRYHKPTRKVRVDRIYAKI